jgi:sugar transferase (PEP-CTERM system associated)
MFKRRVLVFGAGRRAGSIARLRRRSDRRGFSVVSYLTADGDEPGFVEPSAVIAHPNSLLAYCEENFVDEIVVAMDDRRRGFPMEQLLECRLEGIEVIELVTFLERETGKVRLDVLNPSWMIFSDGFRQGRIHSVLERIFDVAASLLLLLVALPFMLLTALAIKLEDGLRAPILYRQTRVGQYGRPFRLMKFRSMRIDAEKEGAPIWASKNDSRITRIGSFIRKTRIDELPQILNVLRGQMSFVGPRPERPEFVSRLNERIPYYRERHSIKPGLTGWAQLCYPYGSSENDAVEKLQYDLFYVKNHSPLFYLAIVIQTVEVIVWGKGAR